MPLQASAERGYAGQASQVVRTPIVLACTECQARNYKTSKKVSQHPGQVIELRKYCKHCKKHTLHRETK